MISLLFYRPSYFIQICDVMSFTLRIQTTYLHTLLEDVAGVVEAPLLLLQGLTKDDDLLKHEDTSLLEFHVANVLCDAQRALPEKFSLGCNLSL